MTRRSTHRLLLDTHVWYWYVSGSRDLPGSLRDAVDEPGPVLAPSPKRAEPVAAR
jgi:PIN domain nuclease of toxin-antitoxin system